MYGSTNMRQADSVSGGDLVRITVTCPMCRMVQEPFIVGRDEWYSWISGNALISDAMPNLTATQHELIRTGTCDPCWEGMH